MASAVGKPEAMRGGNFPVTGKKTGNFAESIVLHENPTWEQSLARKFPVRENREAIHEQRGISSAFSTETGNLTQNRSAEASVPRRRVTLGSRSMPKCMAAQHRFPL
jgi:hypothetical protein